MSYIEKLIEHGTNFKVKRGSGIASFGPVSGDGYIEAFQGGVEELRRNEGDGYSIHSDHPMSDRGGSSSIRCWSLSMRSEFLERWFGDGAGPQDPTLPAASRRQ